ncbi:MAG: insulinase family protein [Deltaproteobacteria bacterium]|nr:MAG: insulinase family protein [Deltaproteobacteria bacterium]
MCWNRHVILGLLMLWGACGPRVLPGPSSHELAATAPEVRLEPDDVRRLSLELLAGGSRWDPPGLEGRAWRALHSAYAHLEHAQVTVGRDVATVHLPCTDQPPEDCASALVRPLRNPQPPRALPPMPEPTLLDHLLAALFEGHPYQHPPQGWPETREALRPHDLEHFFSTQIARSTVVATASDPSLHAALRAALEDLPVRLPPDPAMFGPPQPPSLALIVLPSSEPQARIALGLTAPRSALAATPLDAPEIEADRSLLHALTGAGIWPPESNPGPSLLHRAAIAISPAIEPAEAERIIQRLPDTWAEITTTSAAHLDPYIDCSPTVLVSWPHTIEDPWHPRVPPGGYAQIHRPLLSEPSP